MATQDYGNVGNSMLVEGKRKAWRRNFAGTALNPEVWAVSGTAPGMTYSVAGGALTVNMNTGINEELVIQSVQGFQIPFRVQFHHTMSQRIANNEVYLEVVNAAGNTYQGWMFDGTTTTLAKSVHMNSGSSLPASPTGTVTVTATPGPVIRELDCRMEAVDVSDRTVDSSTASSTRWVKSRTTLDPDEVYFIRLRFKNLGVAPASNTVNTFETILVQDTNDLLVEVGAARGNNGANRSLSVSGTVTTTWSSQSVSPSVSATVGTAPTGTRFQAVTNAGQSVKASAGKLWGFTVSNAGAAALWFNVYNSTTVTIGTTVPLVQVLVPAGQTILFEPPYGVNFGTGMMVAATDTSAPLSAIAPATAALASVFWI